MIDTLLLSQQLVFRLSDRIVDGDYGKGGADCMTAVGGYGQGCVLWLCHVCLTTIIASSLLYQSLDNNAWGYTHVMSSDTSQHIDA